MLYLRISLQFFIGPQTKPMKDFPGGSGGQRACLQCGRPGFDPWVGKIPWRRKCQPTPVLLPGKSHRRRSLQCRGSQIVGHNWAASQTKPQKLLTSFWFYFIGISFCCALKMRQWNAKVGSQETAGVTGKFGLGVQNEAGQRLTVFLREHTGHSKQHKRRLYTWTSPDGQHWNQTDYILCSQRWISSIQWAKTRPGPTRLWLRSWTPYWQIQT